MTHATRVELGQSDLSPVKATSAVAAPVAPVAAPALPVPLAKANRGRLMLENLSKRFGATNAAAIENVTLRLSPGEFVVVVGPSGCGKTTLLNLAAGMIAPDAGRVELDGQNVHGPGPDRAVVFQDHALFPWLTAAQNVEFGLKMAGVAPAERRERVERVLAMVHLPRAGGKLVHELSGGMKQRIAIARALVMDPAVLLMDEPFAALDAQTRTLLHQQLQDLWLQTRKSVLFVTHSVGEAVRLADRIVVLHAQPGRIRAEIPIELPHPRQSDSPHMSELGRRVRKEIEDEVNRVNAEMAQDDWKPAAVDDLGGSSGGMGDGI